MSTAMNDRPGAPISGRAHELTRLSLVLAAARSGRPSVALIDGVGGIGKTALVRQLAATAGGGVPVLWSSGDPSERAVPFAVADQLLRRAGVDASVMDAKPSHYTGVGLTILEALGSMQTAGPVILVVDDAHWADPASLRALLFAIRRLVSDAVLTVLTARTEDLHLLPEGFSRLVQSPPNVHVTLGPLALDDVRAIVRGRDLPLSAQAVGQVHDLSAGVPLHACALLDELAATEDFTHIVTPPSYSALIVGRLSECGADARRLVEAAAVVGRRAPLGEVAQIAGVDEHTLDALDEAVARDLIKVSNRTIEFIHPLIRSSV